MRLARHGLGDKTSEINRRGVETALRAADGAAWVIGSIGPTGLNPSHLRRSESEVAATFIEQATALRETPEPMPGSSRPSVIQKNFVSHFGRFGL